MDYLQTGDGEWMILLWPLQVRASF